MMFKQKTLKAIEAGEVSLAFRHWNRSTVRQGETRVTAVGVFSIDAVD